MFYKQDIMLPVEISNIRKAFILEYNCYLHQFNLNDITKNVLLYSRTFFENYILIGIEIYNSNALLTLLSINNSNGFSSASLMATKNPTDSFPSMIR